MKKWNLTILRHGETLYNCENRMMGHCDSELTENGIQQILTRRNLIMSTPFSHIFSSDLGRAQKTTELLIKGTRYTPVYSPFFRERSYGKHEARYGHEFKKEFKYLLDALVAMPHDKRLHVRLDDDIETTHEIYERFVRGLSTLLTPFSPGNALIVTHWGCIRAIIEKHSYFDGHVRENERMANGGFIRLKWSGHFNFTWVESNGLQ